MRSSKGWRSMAQSNGVYLALSHPVSQAYSMDTIMPLMLNDGLARTQLSPWALRFLAAVQHDRDLKRPADLDHFRRMLPLGRPPQAQCGPRGRARKSSEARRMTKKTTRENRPLTLDEVVSTHLSGDAINRVRQIIRDAVPDAVESVKWSAPSFSTTDHFATFFLGGKRRVAEFQVVLHLGAKPRLDSAVRSQVRDPSALLEWRSPDRAVVTFRDANDVAAKASAFRELVREWASFLRAPNNGPRC